MNAAQVLPWLFAFTAMQMGSSSPVSSHLDRTPRGLPLPVASDLRLDPSEAMAFAGENVTFTCYSPVNATLHWNFADRKTGPVQFSTGQNQTSTGQPVFYSSATLRSVTRAMSGEVRCRAEGGEPAAGAMAFLIVSGVRIGGSCQSSTDCIADSTCQEGACSCPKNHVLIRLTENGYEVCKEIIYRLYDPCEFNEQCFHLVDSKSICASNSVCTCAPWAIDINGRCVSRSEISYTKNQEMYRVGLIAVTCVIILVVAVSLWITLRSHFRSCRESTGDDHRSFPSPEADDHPNSMTMEGVDKPPSYDDVQNTAAAVNSPPNFREALTNSMTAKKLLRQVSAPAGQLLKQSVDPDPKSGCDSKVFSADS